MRSMRSIAFMRTSKTRVKRNPIRTIRGIAKDMSLILITLSTGSSMMTWGWDWGPEERSTLSMTPWRPRGSPGWSLSITDSKQAHLSLCPTAAPTATSLTNSLKKFQMTWSSRKRSSTPPLDDFEAGCEVGWGPGLPGGLSIQEKIGGRNQDQGGPHWVNLC